MVHQLLVKNENYSHGKEQKYAAYKMTGKQGIVMLCH